MKLTYMVLDKCFQGVQCLWNPQKLTKMENEINFKVLDKCL